jgi:hypothetical protein
MINSFSDLELDFFLVLNKPPIFLAGQLGHNS